MRRDCILSLVFCVVLLLPSLLAFGGDKPPQYKPPTFPYETAYEKEIYRISEKYLRESTRGTENEITDAELRELRASGGILEVNTILILGAVLSYAEHHTQQETEVFSQHLHRDLEAAAKLRTPEDDRRDKVRAEAFKKYTEEMAGQIEEGVRKAEAEEEARRAEEEKEAERSRKPKKEAARDDEKRKEKGDADDVERAARAIEDAAESLRGLFGR